MIPFEITVYRESHKTTLNWSHVRSIAIQSPGNGRTVITMADGTVYLTTEKKFEIVNRIKAATQHVTLEVDESWRACLRDFFYDLVETIRRYSK